MSGSHGKLPRDLIDSSEMHFRTRPSSRPWRISPQCLVFLGLLALAAMLPGCGRASSPPGTSAGKSATEESNSSPAQGAAPATSDFWQADFMQDQQVGWTHTIVTIDSEGNQNLTHTISESELSIRRFDTVLSQKIRLESVDTSDGILIRCQAQTTTGPEVSSVEGVVEEGALKLRSRTPGRVQDDQLPWKRDVGGYFATEQNLLRAPMRPGERRSLKALIPVLNQIGEVELNAIDWQETKLLDGAARLLKIEQQLNIGGNRLQAVLWSDEHGELQKQELPALQQVSYRTTKEVAQRASSTQSFDLGRATVVKVTNPAGDLHGRKQLTLQVHVTDQPAGLLFPSSLSQTVQAATADSTEIRLLAVRPDVPATLSQPVEPPREEDTLPNSRIQSDDPRIVTLANQVASDTTDSWKIACALEKHVHDLVQVKGFSLALASAVTVAETHEGDCTEHAVLFAALCRARKLPGRVAIGLVYSPQLEGYAYHMWNEVWIQDRWIPMDATLALGGIGCGHLKLADSSLRTGDDSSAFLPVLQVLGKLKITVKPTN